MGIPVAKLTISLPQNLITFTDEVAKEMKMSRSKVISSCLEELAKKRLRQEMEEGYRVMAEEHAKFAETVSAIAHEVIPEWGQGSDGRRSEARRDILGRLEPQKG